MQTVSAWTRHDRALRSRGRRYDPLENRSHRIIRDCRKLFGGAVLDWVRHPDQRRRKAERLRLCLSRRLKLFGGHRAARDPATVEGQDVMQTARRARPSVSQPFDHHVAFVDDGLNDEATFQFEELDKDARERINEFVRRLRSPA